MLGLSIMPGATRQGPAGHHIKNGKKMTIYRVYSGSLRLLEKWATPNLPRM